MPFKSEDQRIYLMFNKPEVYKKFKIHEKLSGGKIIKESNNGQKFVAQQYRKGI
jgi:hypothetical protein